MSQYSYRDIKIKGLSAAVPAQNKKPDSSVSDVKNIRIALPEQTASDLGFAAAKQLLEAYNVDKVEIACLVFASLSPDYRSPATAAVLLYRLGIREDCIAYDLVLGATGLIAGLQKAAAVLESCNKKFALVVAADTNSKMTDEMNPAAHYLSDGASAILIEKNENSPHLCIELHTLNKEWESFTHKAGGYRVGSEIFSDPLKLHANKAVINQLQLNHTIFEKVFLEQSFNCISAFIKSIDTEITDFDHVILQPVSIASLKTLTSQLDISATTLMNLYYHYGNLSASAAPVYLSANKNKDEKKPINVLAIAFGEGLSMGLIRFTIDPDAIQPLIETDEVFNEGSVSHVF